MHATGPGSILLADHLQIFILISLKLMMDSYKKSRWINSFKKFSRVRVNIDFYLFFLKKNNKLLLKTQILRMSFVPLGCACPLLPKVMHVGAPEVVLHQ